MKEATVADGFVDADELDKDVGRAFAWCCRLELLE
jgi:hypothetical protein